MRSTIRDLELRIARLEDKRASSFIQTLRERVEEGEPLTSREALSCLREVDKEQASMKEACVLLYSVVFGAMYSPAMLEGRGETYKIKEDPTPASSNIDLHFDIDALPTKSLERQKEFLDACQKHINILRKLRESIKSRL
jgi:hypothetical protein